MRVKAIQFAGEIEIVETRLPLALAAEYRRTADGEVISQVIGFEPIEVHGVVRSFEMHRIPSAEQMQVVIRNLPKKLA